MKLAFVGKDEVIDLLGVSLVAGENLFILGPPGTAKSALVQELSRRIDGQVFDYLLTRFTEPNELFGPFDIRKLREGELVTNTEGMLPEAAFVFLDELWNANSAILNSLLMVLNERVFRRGRETRKLPTLMVVSASNRLPDDDALHRCLLAYASDFYLLPTATVPHGQEQPGQQFMLASIDHAMWFHRPVRVDEWLLCVTDSPIATGARGFTRGSVFDRSGRLVASLAQEGLMRAVADRGAGRSY